MLRQASRNVAASAGSTFGQLPRVFPKKASHLAMGGLLFAPQARTNSIGGRIASMPES